MELTKEVLETYLVDRNGNHTVLPNGSTDQVTIRTAIQHALERIPAPNQALARERKELADRVLETDGSVHLIAEDVKTIKELAAPAFLPFLYVQLEDAIEPPPAPPNPEDLPPPEADDPPADS